MKTVDEIISEIEETKNKFLKAPRKIKIKENV